MANLLTANESDFEAGLSGYSLQYGVTSVVRSTSSPIAGTASMLITVSDQFWEVWTDWPGKAIVPGTTYYGAFTVQPPSGRTVEVTVTWYSSGGVAVGSDWTLGVATNGVPTVTGNAVAPAGAAYGIVRFGSADSVAGDQIRGDTFWFGDTAPTGGGGGGGGTGGSSGGTNLLLPEESTFESSFAGWEGLYGTTSVARTTVSPTTGAGSMLITLSAAFWGVWKNFPGVAVTAGETYFCEAVITPPALRTVNLQVVWRNASDADISAWAVGSAHGPETVSGTAVAPSGATHAMLQMFGSNGVAGDLIRVDDIFFGLPAGSPPPPAPGTQVIPAEVWDGSALVTGLWETFNGAAWIPVGESSLGLRTCTAPIYTASGINDGTTIGAYYVHNNAWGTSPGPQTINVCNYDNWNVVSNQVNSGGAVKTYPNVHLDINNLSGAPMNNYATITSNFSATSPHIGVYNVAYDLWLNGVGWGNGHTEVMVWTENFNQVPLGSNTGNVTFGGQVYQAWHYTDAGSGGVNVVTFVATPVILQGTLDLKAMITWAIGQGWIPSNPTINQIGFGVEIVSTGGTNQQFDFHDFSVTMTPATSPWTQWSNGPTAPIPVMAFWPNVLDFATMRTMGFTHAVLPKSDTTNTPASSLTAARTAGIKVICGYRSGLIATHGDVIEGWFVEPDEPDDAKYAVPAGGAINTPVPPAQVNDTGGTFTPTSVLAIQTADPTRPVFLSLASGVCDPNYIGRGVDAGTTAPYSGVNGYLKRAGIVSFDYYPGSYIGSSHSFIRLNFALSTTGIDNLQAWWAAAGRTPALGIFGQWVEGAPVYGTAGNGGRSPTQAEMREQVQRSLAAGASYIAFFQTNTNDPAVGGTNTRYGFQDTYYRNAMSAIIAEFT